MKIDNIPLYMIMHKSRWLTWTRYGNSNSFVSAIADSTGNKISREDAEYFFPNLPIRLYRS